MLLDDLSVPLLDVLKILKENPEEKLKLQIFQLLLYLNEQDEV